MKAMRLGLLLAIGWALAGTATAGDVRVRARAGLTLASGVIEMNDRFENTLNAGQDFYWPAGLRLEGGVEFAVCKFYSLEVDVNAGPVTFVAVQSFGLGGNDDYAALLVPIGFSLRNTFLPEKPVSPYVRVGVSYIGLIDRGDVPLLANSRPGLDVAAGIEFFRNRRFGFGLEGGWNGAELDQFPDSSVEKKLNPIGWFGSVYASFKL
jgi:hypothetical protein